MSIVKVQRVAPVHFRVGRCHQMKKRHRMWLLSKVFTDLEKVFSLKWGCPPPEAFHWWRGECSADPAVRSIVECSVGVSRTGRHCLEDQMADSGFLESAEVDSHRLSGPSAALLLTLELGSEPQTPLSTGSLGERFCFQNLFSSHHGITCFTLSIPNKRTAICKYFHVRIV